VAPGRSPAANVVLGIDLTGVLTFVEQPDPARALHASRYIRAAEGGTVELNGFRVDIPAGALPADTLVTIDLPSDPVLGRRLLAEFGPHAVPFAVPVTLTFPLEGVALTGAAVEVARWEGGAWRSLGGTVDPLARTLSSTTSSFSSYSGKYVLAGG
jgi:hypothetical protein